VCDARPVCRLGLAHPEQFCEREIRERRIAGKLNQPIATKHFLELTALRFAPLITPDNCRSHHFVRGIEQNRAMHLAGKADAGNIGSS
jgi:hypothetical protein